MNTFPKRLIFVLFVGWLALTATIAACAPATTAPEPTGVAVSPTHALSPTDIPTATLTSVPSPQATATALPPTPTPHPLLSPEPSITPTPMSTRTFEEQEVLLAQLMAQPAACPLPCWWAFELPIPLGSVDSHLADLGLSGLMMNMPAYDDPGKMGSINLGYYDPATRTNYVDVWTQFHAIDEEVIYIAVTAARPLVSAGWMEFQRDWKPYYFDAMIERLGLPPYAYLFPMSLTESAPGIVMVLFYPERGINVTYTFRDSAATQSPGEFCFDLDLVQELKLSLYAPARLGSGRHMSCRRS